MFVRKVCGAFILEVEGGNSVLSAAPRSLPRAILETQPIIFHPIPFTPFRVPN